MHSIAGLFVACPTVPWTVDAEVVPMLRTEMKFARKKTKKRSADTIHHRHQGQYKTAGWIVSAVLSGSHNHYITVLQTKNNIEEMTQPVHIWTVPHTAHTHLRLETMAIPTRSHSMLLRRYRTTAMVHLQEIMMALRLLLSKSQLTAPKLKIIRQ